MTEYEKELKRIMQAYIDLAAYNMDKAIENYVEKCKEISDNYKKQLNDNSNKT